MTPTSTSKPRRVSYSGFAATQYELNFGSKSPTGKRVVITKYDNGNVTIRAIKGDGRTPSFREFEAFSVVTDLDNAFAIARDMADRHFA
jgi:hypothetical protein